MKKVFLFLATAALFASCSDDLLEPNNGFQAQDLSSKGITFQVVKDDPATRGMLEKNDDGSYSAYFFAEQDQIDIYFKNAFKGAVANTKLSSLTEGLKAWDKTNNKVTYKATSSMADPKFTAVSANDMLNLVDFQPATTDPEADAVTTKGEFFAAYPTGQAVSHVAKTEEVAEHFEITAEDLSNQSYNGFLDMSNRYMYAYANASKQKDEDIKTANKSVGERVNLSLKSPLSTALFVIRDLNKYKTTLGTLSEITITSTYTPLLPNTNTISTYAADNYVKVENKYYHEGDLTPTFGKDSCVTYKDNKIVYTVNSGAKEQKDGTKGTDFDEVSADYYTYTPDPAGGGTLKYVTNKHYVKTAKLTVSTQPAQDEEMNLFVLPTTDTDKGHKETYTITYAFANVTLKYSVSTNAKFSSNTGSLRFPLTIEKKFKYIVTDKAEDKALLVNSGKLSDIFEKDGEGKPTGNIIWNTAEGGTVAANTIKSVTIGAGVEANNGDGALLNKFTGATTLTILNGMTELKDMKDMAALETLSAANVTTVAQDALPYTITELYLPKVTSFAAPKEAASKFSSLADLNLASYNSFGGKVGDVLQAKPEVFFNSSTASKLETVDLSSITNLRAVYEQHDGIFFTGYTKLETVKLNPAGTKINVNEFKNCTALKSVTGTLDISLAENAFEFETGKNPLADLDTITIKGTVIPACAFKGSKITTVKVADGSKITSIGKEAFMSNTAIVALDLSAATAIGESAFEGATSFVGSGTAAAPTKVELIVAKVAKKAFDGTKIVNFRLKNATETEELSLNSSALTQIYYEASPLENIAVKGTGLQGQVGANRENVLIFVQTQADGAKFSGQGYKSIEIVGE